MDSSIALAHLRSTAARGNSVLVLSMALRVFINVFILCKKYYSILAYPIFKSIKECSAHIANIKIFTIPDDEISHASIWLLLWNEIWKKSWTFLLLILIWEGHRFVSIVHLFLFYMKSYPFRWKTIESKIHFKFYWVRWLNVDQALSWHGLLFLIHIIIPVNGMESRWFKWTFKGSWEMVMLLKWLLAYYIGQYWKRKELKNKEKNRFLKIMNKIFIFSLWIYHFDYSGWTDSKKNQRWLPVWT